MIMSGGQYVFSPQSWAGEGMGCCLLGDSVVGSTTTGLCSGYSFWLFSLRIHIGSLFLGLVRSRAHLFCRSRRHFISCPTSLQHPGHVAGPVPCPRRGLIPGDAASAPLPRAWGITPTSSRGFSVFGPLWLPQPESVPCCLAQDQTYRVH